jgi:hypothetical protein
MSIRKLPLLLAGVIIAGGAGLSQADERRVPVMVGGEIDLDACASVAMVTGLDPAGDNVLVVRTGPDVSYAKADRLPPSASVHVCEERGNWRGIVYPAGECGVATPIAAREAYKGPCKSGWVYGDYLSPLAG